MHLYELSPPELSCVALSTCRGFALVALPDNVLFALTHKQHPAPWELQCVWTKQLFSHPAYDNAQAEWCKISKCVEICLNLCRVQDSSHLDKGVCKIYKEDRMLAGERAVTTFISLGQGSGVLQASWLVSLGLFLHLPCSLPALLSSLQLARPAAYLVHDNLSLGRLCHINHFLYHIVGVLIFHHGV